MPTRRFMFKVFIAPAAGLALPGVVTGPASAFPAGQRFICTEPGCLPFIYNPAEGDPQGGIPPGTPFADIPADWRCPVCGVTKDDFIPFG